LDCPLITPKGARALYLSHVETNTMLKKVSSNKETPSPVIVNKGKHGYNCWVYVSTVQKNQKTYHKYKVAHKFSKKFVSEEDALLYGWAKINGHNVSTYDVPMRHKPIHDLVTILRREVLV
jgi:hypothetical protein